jgi:hypothetical protein
MSTSDRHSRRDVETDRLLERELRDAVGPEAAAEAMKHADDMDATAPRGTLASWVTARGPLLAVSFAAFVVIGVIVSLATGSWWALVAALAVHAAGTLVVATTALRLTTETEHVSSELAERLEAEGIDDPDRAFTELAAGSAGPGDVLRDGRNERTAHHERDAARAAREQRTAMTPGSDPSAPAGHGSVVGAMPFSVVVGCMLVTLVVAIAGGGVLWAVAALTWAGGAVWMLLRRRGVPESGHLFATGLVGLVAAVAAFAVLLGLLSDRL